MLLLDDSMDVRLEILEELANVVSSFCLQDGLDRALGPALVAQASCSDSRCCQAVMQGLPAIIHILNISQVCHAQSHCTQMTFICLHHAS